MKYLSIKILIIIFISNNIFAQFEDAHFYLQNFQATDYNASTQNWAIIQDNRGFIYIGNGDGVLEFDGKNWRLIKNSNQSNIRNLALDKYGKIFCGGQSEIGFLEPDSIGNLKYKSLISKIPPDFADFKDVLDMYFIGDTLYFQTYNYVFFTDFKNDTIFNVINSTDLFHNSFYVDNKLFIRERTFGLKEFRNDSLYDIKNGDLFTRNFILGIYLCEDKSFTIISDVGTYKYYCKEYFEKDTIIFSENNFNNIFSDKSILCTKQLENGNFVFGTYSNGIIITDENFNLLQTLNKENGLIDDLILDIYIDSFQNLWVATGNGISYILIGTPFSYYSENDGFKGVIYTSYYSNDILYAGGSSGLFYKKQTSEFHNLSGIIKQTWFIKEFDNKIFTGNFAGFFDVKDSIATNIIGKENIWDFKPIPNSEKLLIGTYNFGFGVVEKQNNNYEYSHLIEGFEKSCRFFEFDEFDNLWYSDYNTGVYKLKLNKNLDSLSSIEFFDDSAGLPGKMNNYVFNIQHNNHKKILFTTSKGVYKFNYQNNIFEADTFFNNLIGDYEIDLLVQDLSYNIWFQQFINEKYRRGYINFDENNNCQVFETPFRKFNSLYFENISFFSKNIVAFNTSEGLILYDFEKEKNVKRDFKAVIRKVFVANKLRFNGFAIDSLNKKLEIPYKENSIKFVFSGLFFEDNDKNQFSYMLEGYENEWSEWTLNTEKEYTNLREGNYCFKVKSKNVYGVESSIAKYQFKIKTPYYRTILAYILYFIFAIVLIIIIVKINVYRLKQEKISLEKIVAERTKEITLKNAILQQQKEEIQAQADNLVEANNMLSEKNEEINQQNEEIQAQADNLLVANEQISAQKEEIERALDNLKILYEIGQAVTKHLSIESIIDTVYENLNKLFNSEVFAIGIFNSKDQTLDFYGAKENNQTLPFFSDNLNENDRLSVICFNQQKEILINNYLEEFAIYFPELPISKVGDITNSILYIPLRTQNKKLGVITIQSFITNAYSISQFETLKNLSIYISIALENAAIFNEINEQKIIIEEKNEHITASINYASRIQTALLPDIESLNAAFLDYFIFWRPRDIVSGDFYWLRIINEYRIIAVADCTGHGVPGAFVSMLGIAFLNEIVYRKDVTKAAHVLNLLRDFVKKALKQNAIDAEQKDGMDIALCVINRQTEEIQYAGANNPLIVVRKKENLEIAEQIEAENIREDKNEKFILSQIRADSQPIGVYFRETAFKNNTFKYQDGDVFYLLTDGFPDQIGGIKKQKFLIKNFRQLILSIQEKTMEEQKLLIENEFDTWKGDLYQVDDVLVVGFEV